MNQQPATRETTGPPDVIRKKEAKKATGVAVFGTFVEYYDFSVYGYVAATIAIAFFPAGNTAAALLNSFAVFGLAFVARPAGAWFFGRLGDTRGRRTALIATITLMGIASGVTGLLPVYAQIGIVAPALLVMMRFLQGFSAGGEIGGAAAYIREWAKPERRAFYISFIPSFANLGKGLAAGVAAIMATSLSAEQMVSWGWRVPFLLAIPMAFLVIWMRLHIEDSPEFRELQRSNEPTPARKTPLRTIFLKHPAALIKVTLIATVQTTGTYVGTVFVATYFSEFLGFTSGQASTIVLLAVLFAALLIPFAGMLGNRLGGRKLLLLCYAGYVLVTLPEFFLMQQHSFGLALIGLMIGILPYALCQAGTYSTMPELYPTEVRHTGISFGHSTGSVIGGGLMPYLSTFLIGATDNTYMPAFLLILAGLIGLVTVGVFVRPNPNGTHLYR